MTTTDPDTRVRHEQPAGRRPWTWWAGLALVVGGLAVLGWVGWQFYGTNWVSQRHQAEAVEQLRDHWHRGEGDAVGGAPGQAEGADGVQVSGGRATAVVRIPKLGDDYAVPLLEGTSDEVLATGFGHFDGVAGPGQQGNFAVAAHRVTHGEPLRDMDALRAGDEVLVETRKWTYVYELTSDGSGLRVPFTEVWVLDPVPDNPDPGEVEPAQKPGQRLLTLTTCAELFHTDDRWIAFGVLKEKRPTSLAAG